MMPTAAVALALAYAAAATAALGGAGQVAGMRPGPRGLSLLFTTLLFVTLTQLPLPDAGSLHCPLAGTDAVLHPFDIVWRMVDRWPRSRSIVEWLTWSGLVAAGMNLLLCAVIGALLALFSLRTSVVVALGFALSLAAELTQITALWGLYPCPYRVFDVDDLIHNTLGVAMGAAWVRWRR